MSQTLGRPWNYKQFQNVFKGGRNLYNQGPQQYYQGQQIAPFSGYTRGFLNSLANRAQNGSGINRAAGRQLTNTLNGKYMKQGNPYLGQAIDSATRPVIDAYNQNVAPGIDSTFSGAGRYGSGAHAMGAAEGANNMMNQVGDISSNMSYQNYSDERSNQIKSMLFAPTLANQDYVDINALGQAGNQVDQYNQSLIDVDKDKWNFTQNAPWDNLQRYAGIVSGNGGGQLQKTSSNINPFTGALGGAMVGGSVGSAIPGLGTGLGALLGGGAGLLGSWWGN
jgi:hypothetical protein